jgi:hypothetical protein
MEDRTSSDVTEVWHKVESDNKAGLSPEAEYTLEVE